jgi:hypothetical protein
MLSPEYNPEAISDYLRGWTIYKVLACNEKGLSIVVVRQLNLMTARRVVINHVQKNVQVYEGEAEEFV